LWYIEAPATDDPISTRERRMAMRLSVRALALAFGIFWGVSVFICTWWIILLYGASGARTFLGLFYLGYNISPVGSIIGLIWGFFDGLVCGAIFGWLYNLLVGKAAEGSQA
jgi:uncharacterized membrane protein YccC